MTDRGITAIETRYAGHRFRSRTEARWAIYFDHAGIAWEYEPQGVQLSSGPYLPDFYLPGLAAWFEVKGTWGQVGDVARFHELVSRSGRHVLLAADRPTGGDQIQVFSARPSPLGVSDPEISHSVPIIPILGCFEVWEGTIGIGFTASRGTGPIRYVFKMAEHPGPDGLFPEAIRAAQDARFEHGETPQSPWA